MLGFVISCRYIFVLNQRVFFFLKKRAKLFVLQNNLIIFSSIIPLKVFNFKMSNFDHYSAKLTKRIYNMDNLKEAREIGRRRLGHINSNY